MNGATRRHHGNVVFTAVVAVTMLAGASVMAFVLFASGAPGALVVGTLLAALPVGPLVAVFLWLDRYEPEPRTFIVTALGWGALVATAAALVLQSVDQFAFGRPESLSAAVVAPITEEAAKGVFVLLLVLARRHVIDGVLDGIVYAGMVGIGFAFTENILYLAAAYMGGEGMGPGGIEAVTGTFVIRGIFSPFAHPLFTAAIGVGIGYAVVTRSAFWRIAAPLLGYAVAVLAHALWNGAAYFGGGEVFVVTYLFLMVPAFFLVAAFAVWARRREGEMLARSLTDAAHRGFIAPHEVPWLVRIPGRRAAREHARRVGGEPALRAMREYQEQAIELGFLHDRFLRGTAPADVQPRGQAMVDRLAELRPYVGFPTGPGTTSVTQPWLEGGR
ncbi:MAG TPA: PrsW family intramembrane metalloprotease [Nocardioidaceae bacterium]|nr:PrsW family intramembrane metalloprotease [Nocardioidaceae bacterium]